MSWSKPFVDIQWCVYVHCNPAPTTRVTAAGFLMFCAWKRAILSFCPDLELYLDPVNEQPKWDN